MSLVLLILVVPVVHALQAMHAVPTFHLDGAFQTASGLFRLGEGQWPGRDFFPYLGIGPVAVLYPAFVAMGGSLTASTFSSYLMTMLAFQLVVGLLAALFFRRRPVWALLWGAAVPAVLVGAAMVRPGLWGIADGLLTTAAVPGNSLRPLRAVAPYLIAAVAFFVLRPRWTTRRAAVVGAAAGVVAAIWSNDYGLVSGGVILVLVTFHVLRWQLVPRLRGLVALWGSALAAYLVSGFAATAGHFPALVSYNFVDVREDQFWYFGPWSRDDRVYSLGDLLSVMWSEQAVYPLLVLVATTVYGLASRDLGALLVPFTGASVLAGGLAATIGGHSGGYFWSFVLWGYVTTAVAVARLGVWLLARGGRTRELSQGRVGRLARAGLAVATVAALLVAAAASLRANWNTERALAEDPQQVWEPQLDGYIPEAFLDQLDEVSGRSDVVEEYMGLAGAVNGPNLSLPVDSIIAALGSQRQVFAERMAERPSLVVTTDPDASIWSTWNVSANWWFYRDLFKSYAPERSTPLTLNWTPVEPATWEAVPCDVDGSRIELAAPDAGFYEVTLRYEGPGRSSRSYTMVENNIAVTESALGFMALDPGARVQQFPVAVHDPGSGTTVLSTKDISAGSEPLTALESCTAAAIAFPEGADTAEIFSSFQLTPVDLTDEFWDRGVHRDVAGLFIRTTEMNLADLRRADEIRFSDGETREIAEIQDHGKFVNVILEGPPLDPEVAGAGNVFVPVD
ncbi:hypothetical protein QOZ88_09210 [Blastococcus sp. BMG 814]|uniref:Uncharacterized protein n=1 Tax=Blastococcus carthaginiensis TaxID=3050034 RepID=A0ABT9IB69_9ACTN|nr:hypothetical protein [Blastococcus carthaginiensis]MDP5182818.1 hypothetical protein [Blastococcus carthaginiensis]